MTEDDTRDGVSVCLIDCVRTLAGMTERDLVKIASDRDEPVARRTAAKLLLRAIGADGDVNVDALWIVLDLIDGETPRHVSPIGDHMAIGRGDETEEDTPA